MYTNNFSSVKNIKDTFKLQIIMKIIKIMKLSKLFCSDKN